MTAWATAVEAAKHVKVSTDLIRTAVKLGELPAYRVGKGGREYRLDLSEVDAWMKSRSWDPTS